MTSTANGRKKIIDPAFDMVICWFHSTSEIITRLAFNVATVATVAVWWIGGTAEILSLKMW
jgi:hypothetical protein